MDRARRVVPLVLAAALTAALAFFPPPRPTQVAVYHFNDFHGQVEPVLRKGSAEGGLSRLVGLLRERKAQAAANERTALVLFAGDLFTGTAFSTLFQGEPETTLLSQVGLNGATTGNHEWDFGAEVLRKRAEEASFPFLLCNVTAEEGHAAFWKPYTILRAGPLRVALTGVTTPETPLTTAPGNTAGYRFMDPVTSLRALLSAHGSEGDLWIVLSHCGFEQDRRIAREVPGVALVVGGHDHRILERPWVESGVPIVQAGDRGRYLGEVLLLIHGKRVEGVEGRLLPVTDATTADRAAEAFLSPFLEEEKKRLGAPVGRLPAPLSGDRVLLRTGEAPLGNLLTDAMRLASGADCAFLNGGAIRAGLPAGEVTGRDLYACLPFFDSLTTVELSGADLKALLDRCAALPQEDPSGGFLQVSGLTVRYEGGKAAAVFVGGEPLAPDRTYTVACTQFLLFGGDGLAEFKNGRNARDWGIGLQELLRRTLARPGFTPPEKEGRILRR